MINTGTFPLPARPFGGIPSIVHVLKQNSLTYNFVEVCWCNLESSQTEVSLYKVYIISQFQTTFAGGGGGGVEKNPLVEGTE